MNKSLYVFIAGFFLALLVWAKPVLADNIYGIHILETAEISRAASLVNSTGGDWGWVTVVLRDDDFDKQKWQDFFDDCRRFHVIPIVRIATHMEPAGVWAKPKLDELDKWPQFLNSLNWPVKKQIVVVFNEPNHAKEWGGEINPQEYALVLDKLIQSFKSVNSDFFILNAGLDQAADGMNGTLRVSDYLVHMHDKDPEIFNKLDAWCSHSYPNHGFVGLPIDSGPGSIKGYEWELERLKSLGLTKDLDVYITETGWPHKEGINLSNQFYPSEKVAQYLTQAFLYWEKDSKIKAVTPFVLNHPQPPFDNFSWINHQGQAYQQFNDVLGLAKQKSMPEQIESFEIVAVRLPEILPTDYDYDQGKIFIKNTGQWVIGERQAFSLLINQSEPKLNISQIQLKDNSLIYPGETAAFDIKFKTGSQSEEHQLNIGSQNFNIYVFRPFDLTNTRVNLVEQVKTKIKLWWQDFKSD
jgi:hypothetical protein